MKKILRKIVFWALDLEDSTDRIITTEQSNRERLESQIKWQLQLNNFSEILRDKTIDIIKQESGIGGILSNTFLKK